MLTTEQRMERLEREIRQVRIDFERFFNGAPDVNLTEVERRRVRIAVELKALRSSSFKGVEASFRLASLEARFHSYSELFGRRVRQIEVGAPLSPRPARARRGEPGAELVVTGEVDEAAVARFYRSLQSRDGNGPRFDLASFRTYLERQRDAIRAKTGCERVVFQIAEEEGRMKLKARPVREAGRD